MSSILLIFASIAAVFMGISIGSSTVASAFGPVNSSGTSNVFRSAFLAGIFALFGALTQGGSVTETVGSGISMSSITTIQASIILFVAATLVIISVLTSYPMPTAFTVIGAVIGTALGFSAGVNWSSVSVILGYWMVVPVVSLIFSYLIARVLRTYVSKERSEREIKALLLISGIYVSYTAGASAVGLAVGPLAGFSFETSTLLILGGVSILIGAWTYSPRIIRAVSFDYSNVGPRRSVAALMTSGILAQIGIFMGVPISFNEAIIASVIGSGLVEGSSSVSRTKIINTAGAWTGAFLLSILVTFVISIGLERLVL